MGDFVEAFVSTQMNLDYFQRSESFFRNFRHFSSGEMLLLSRSNCPFTLSPDIRVTTETTSKFTPSGRVS